MKLLEYRNDFDTVAFSITSLPKIIKTGSRLSNSQPERRVTFLCTLQTCVVRQKRRPDIVVGRLAVLEPYTAVR